MSEGLMRSILQVLIEKPPKVFVLQTRGPLILRDRDLLLTLTQRTTVRISFSITTNRDAVRQLYEPLCASITKRLDTVRSLVAAGLDVYATLAPLLPCDPEDLAKEALQVTTGNIIGDSFHVRAVKKYGGTTADAGWQVSRQYGYSDWHDPTRQSEVVKRIGQVVNAAGRQFYIGIQGFGCLAVT